MFWIIWDPFGPVWTLLNNFKQKLVFAQKHLSKTRLCPYGATTWFLSEKAQKCPYGPKIVPNSQKHLGWPFWTLLNHFGMLTSLPCLAIFVCFTGSFFFGTPCTNTTTANIHNKDNYAFCACRHLRFWFDGNNVLQYWVTRPVSGSDLGKLCQCFCLRHSWFSVLFLFWGFLTNEEECKISDIVQGEESQRHWWGVKQKNFQESNRSWSTFGEPLLRVRRWIVGWNQMDLVHGNANDERRKTFSLETGRSKLFWLVDILVEGE